MRDTSGNLRPTSLPVVLWLAAVSVAGAAFAGTPLAESGCSSSASPARPNIVFILTDDQDAASIAFMPQLQALLAAKGTSFSTFLVNVSLCCPSRTTILRGQYSHNTRVYLNSPPDGGYEVFLQGGLEASTLGVWLQQAGYRTGFFGKYLNGYPAGDAARVPAGWDDWHSLAAGSPYGNFDYTMNENGVSKAYGHTAGEYMTDVLAGKAAAFVERSAAEGRPFFAEIATYAPHSPATPAPRHASLFAGAQAPRTASFNEADVSDKPAWVQATPLLSAAEIADIDALYRKRLQSLQAVDDLVATVVSTLEATGQRDNTFIFFTSDNGFHLGQHRLPQGKLTPYEEDIVVPMLVRGPGVPAGQVLDHLVGNVDLAPTFAELAGAAIPDWVDGKSLVPLLGAAPPSSRAWREAFLLEKLDVEATAEMSAATAAAVAAMPRLAPAGTLEPDDVTGEPDVLTVKVPIGSFRGLRTATHTYVEYAKGWRELYDLATDPDQLANLAANADPALLAALSARLAALGRCVGDGCRPAVATPRARRRLASSS